MNSGVVTDDDDDDNTDENEFQFVILSTTVFWLSPMSFVVVASRVMIPFPITTSSMQIAGILTNTML